MSDEMDDPSDLDTALSMLDGYDPLAVANALPDFHHVIPAFHSNHGLQAQLILAWDAEFASQVLATWKPSHSTWAEVVGSAKDAEHAVKLKLSALGPTGVREAITAAGKVHGGAKQVVLMKALRLSLKQDHRSRPSPIEPGSLDVSTPVTLRHFPIAPSANETPSLPHSEGSSAKSKTTSNPLTVSTNKPLASIIGSNPSGAITQRIGPAQLVSPHSTKENVHPFAHNELKYAKTRPISAQPSQGGSTNIQKLFAADDARRPALVASKTATVTSPQRPKQTQSLRTDTNSYEASLLVKTLPQSVNIGTPSELLTPSIHDTKTSSAEHPDGKIYDTSQLPIIPEETPTSPNDEDYESGMDGVEPIVPHEGGRFPSVDEDEREASTDDGFEDDEEDYGDSERGADSGDESGTVEANDAPIPNEEEYPDGFIDPSLVNPWTWSQKTNDERVELWGVEEDIKLDPRSTAPVRTRWMYEARKGVKSDEEYSDLLQEEHQKFLDIPVACRTAVGQMWFKDSKLDWEIRVFLAPLVYKYALLKDECEAAEEQGDTAEVKKNEANRRTLATEAMAKLMERFPDCSPDHELRKIKEKFGKKELGKYKAKFRNKFTSDAGRMKILYQKSVGNVGIIGASVSMSTLLDLLGRKRRNIAFHLWGRSEHGGQVECDEEIEEEMTEWIARHPKATAKQASQRRITVVQDVCKANFELMDDEDQEKWTKRARLIHKPTTVEEEQCLVEATLPHVVDLLKVLAERGNMHFVLLASSKSSCDVPIFIQEFGRKNVEQGIFLSATDGLGARVRADYFEYALERFGGGVGDAVLRVDTAPTGDLEVDTEADEPVARIGASKGRRKKQLTAPPTVVPPFQPNLSDTKTVPKMAKAISDFVIMGVEKLHGIRATWDKLTKEASSYILVERMPMDPDMPRQRLQLQKPAAMTNARVKTFFDFLLASYDGTLPDQERFRFRLEFRRLNIPSPVAPANPEIHHAAKVAAKTKLPKRSRGNSEPKGRKGKRARKDNEEIDEGFDYENDEDMMQDIDSALLAEALSLSTTGKAQPKASRKVKSLRIKPPPQSMNLTHEPRIGPSSELIISRPTASSKPITAEAPDKPTPKPKPGAKPNSAIELGTDELSHPFLLPDDQETAKIWMETKQYLDLWGGNMTHCEEQSRKMPFLGLSGIKHSIDLPAAIYSTISILQLWSVFQPEAVSGFDVTLPPNLGLSTVQPSHHISKIISLIIDSSKPLPSAKFIHSQSQISPDAASALFLQIEGAVLRFMDEMVASDKSVLDSNLNLLQGMRLASFMGATGFIRDGGKTGSNTERTSALSDRFVQIVAAIAFARYLNLVLGRVTKLYGESTGVFDNKIMWNEVEALWRPACVSLARALVARRADLFNFSTQGVSLPNNFRTLVDFAFKSRPWWTPESKGVPSFVSIPNKQAVASDTFFKHLKGINWTKCSFIERGQILLLILIAAIQIETGRVKDENENPQAVSPARLLANSLSSFRSVLEASGEDGPTEQQILIPEDQVSTWLSKWEMECQILTEEGPLSGVLTNENTTQTRPLPIITDDSGVPSNSPAPVHAVTAGEASVGDRDNAGTAGSQSRLCDPQARSAAFEDTSRVSYEEEDPTLPDSNQPTMSSKNRRGALSPGPQSASIVPAVRPLDGDPLPVAKKKRRTREVEACPLDEIDQGHRMLRSATAARPVQETPPIISGTRASGPRTKAAGLGDVQGTASTRVTRSTAVAPSAGRGRGRSPNIAPTVAPSGKGSSRRGR